MLYAHEHHWSTRRIHPGQKERTVEFFSCVQGDAPDGYPLGHSETSLKRPGVLPPEMGSAWAVRRVAWALFGHEIAVARMRRYCTWAFVLSSPAQVDAAPFCIPGGTLDDGAAGTQINPAVILDQGEPLRILLDLHDVDLPDSFGAVDVRCCAFGASGQLRELYRHESAQYGVSTWIEVT